MLNLLPQLLEQSDRAIVFVVAVFVVVVAAAAVFQESRSNAVNDEMKMVEQ